VLLQLRRWTRWRSQDGDLNAFASLCTGSQSVAAIISTVLYCTYSTPPVTLDFFAWGGTPVSWGVPDARRRETQKLAKAGQPH
jgi:hypothetical protein